MSKSYISPAAQPVGPIQVSHYYSTGMGTQHIVTLGNGGVLHLCNDDAAQLAQLITESIASAAEGVHG